MTKLKKTLIATAIATAVAGFSSSALAGLGGDLKGDPPRCGVLHKRIFRSGANFKKPAQNPAEARRMTIQERTKKYSNGVDLVKIRIKQTNNFKGNFGIGKSEYELQQMKKNGN